MFSILCYTIIGLIAAFVVAVIAGVAKQTPEQRAQIYEQHLKQKAQKAKQQQAQLQARRRYYMSDQYKQDRTSRFRNWLISRL